MKPLSFLNFVALFSPAYRRFEMHFVASSSFVCLFVCLFVCHVLLIYPFFLIVSLGSVASFAEQASERGAAGGSTAVSCFPRLQWISTYLGELTVARSADLEAFT